MKLFHDPDSTDDTDSLADSLETVRVHNSCTRERPCISCRTSELLKRAAGLRSSLNSRESRYGAPSKLSPASAAARYVRNVADAFRGRKSTTAHERNSDVWFQSTKPWRNVSPHQANKPHGGGGGGGGCYERDLRPISVHKMCLHDLPVSRRKLPLSVWKPGRHSCSCSDASEASTSCDSCSPSWQEDSSCSDWSTSCCHHCEGQQQTPDNGRVWRSDSAWDESCILPRYRNQQVHFSKQSPEIFHYWQETLRRSAEAQRLGRPSAPITYNRQDHPRIDYTQNWTRLGQPREQQQQQPLGFSRYGGMDRNFLGQSTSGSSSSQSNPHPLSIPKQKEYVKNNKRSIRPKRYSGYTSQTVAGNGPTSRHSALSTSLAALSASPDDVMMTSQVVQPLRHTVDGAQIIKNRKKPSRALLSSQLFLCCSDTHSNLSAYNPANRPMRRTDC